MHELIIRTFCSEYLEYRLLMKHLTMTDHFFSLTHFTGHLKFNKVDLLHNVILPSILGLDAINLCHCNSIIMHYFDSL